MVIQPDDTMPSVRKRRPTPPLPPADVPGAHKAAMDALAQVTSGAPTIVIWIDGTGGHGAYEEFRAAAIKQHGTSMSIVKLGYPARYDYRSSVATGIEALRQTLAGLAQLRRPDGTPYRVVVIGESQGAWVASDTMMDPAMRKHVDRAVLIGHPSVAVNHYHDLADPDVVELNHRTDPISQPISGPIEGLLDGVGALVERKNPSGVLNILAVALHNPLRALEFLQGTLRGFLFGSGGKPTMMAHDPHNYRDHVDLMVDFVAQPAAGRVTAA